VVGVLSGTLIADLVLAAAAYGLLIAVVLAVLWLTGGEQDDPGQDGREQDWGDGWRRRGPRPEPPPPPGPSGVGANPVGEPVRAPPRPAIAAGTPRPAIAAATSRQPLRSSHRFCGGLPAPSR
jgi:hypothetical protein